MENNNIKRQFYAVLITIALIATQVIWFYNTIEGGKLFLIGAAIGVLCGFIPPLIFRLYNIDIISKFTLTDTKEIFSVETAIIIGLLLPAILYTINHGLSTSPIYHENVKATDKYMGKSSKNKALHYVDFILPDKNSKNETIKVNPEFYDQVVVGSDIDLTLQKGVFGYLYIVDYKNNIAFY